MIREEFWSVESFGVLTKASENVKNIIMNITNRQGIRLTSLVVPKASQAHRNSINIEFKAWVDNTHKDILNETDCLVSPSAFSNIILLHKSPVKDSDIMYAYDGNVNDGCVYIGNWNDGTF